MSEGRAYVYGILIDGRLRYVGKGTGRRMRDHARLARRSLVTGVPGRTEFVRRLAAIECGRNVVAVRFAEALSDQEAFALEARLIAEQPAGQLWNLRPGGKGFTSEIGRKARARAVYTPAAIAARSAAIRETMQRRIAERPEEVERLRQIQKAAWADPVKRAQRCASFVRHRRTPDTIKGAIIAALTSGPKTLDVLEREARATRRRLVQTIHKLKATGEIVKVGGKYDGVFQLSGIAA